MKRYSILTVAILFTLHVTSCKDDPETPDTPGEEGLPIESVRATSRIDLSDRQGWILTVGSSEYEYSIKDHLIEAKAPEKPAHFGKSYPEGTQVPLGGGPVIRLVSPTYNPIKSRDLAPAPPNIHDQSTPEKLLAADLLSCYFSGIAARELEDIELTHANALLDFEVIDFPSDAEVIIGSYMDITPYRQGNHYKAIVLAESGEFDASVFIRSGGNTQQLSIREYMKEFLQSPDIRSISRDTHYQFTIRYDKDKDTFFIDNFHRSKWSGDRYPLSLDLIEKKVVEFRLFVGSPAGAIEMPTDGLDPEEIWKGKMEYYPTMATFDDDENITMTDWDMDENSFIYRFATDSMYRYNPNVERWYLSGTGDKYRLNYRMGFYMASYVKDNWISIYQIGKENEFITEELFNWENGTLDFLTQPTDTIMWCNMHYLYENKSYIGRY